MKRKKRNVSAKDTKEHEGKWIKSDGRDAEILWLKRSMDSLLRGNDTRGGGTDKEGEGN